jgi:hypothetical protein
MLTWTAQVGIDQQGPPTELRESDCKLCGQLRPSFGCARTQKRDNTAAQVSGTHQQLGAQTAYRLTVWMTQIVGHDQLLGGHEFGAFPENELTALADFAAQNLLDDPAALPDSPTPDPVRGLIELILGDHSGMQRGIRESQM